MSEKAIRMNINNWSYQDFVDFTGAVRSGDNAKLFELAQLIIVDWDYKIDLSQPEPMMELGVVESGKVIATIFETLNAYLEDVEISDVSVDFSRWNTRRFLEFDAARRDGKMRKAEDMAREIVVFTEAPVGERLSFKEGAKAFKAINEAYKKLVTGKN